MTERIDGRTLQRGVRKTPPRMDIYDFIVAYKREHGGDSPTRREIGRALPVPLSMVNYHLARLQEEGLIRIGTGAVARTIEVVGANWVAPETAIPKTAALWEASGAVRPAAEELSSTGAGEEPRAQAVGGEPVSTCSRVPRPDAESWSRRAPTAWARSCIPSRP